MTAPTYWALGTYAGGTGGMTDLQTLLYNIDTPVTPDLTFSPFAANADTGAGSRKGMGFPTATMHWALINVKQREALRTICPGLSAHVYVNFPVMDTASQVLVYHTFDAYMLWPTGEEGKEQNLSEVDFKLEFRMLVQVA
jgi:hypothetical protein